MLDRNFYLRDVQEVARDLLGKTLVHKTPEGTASGRIVEVEAYAGGADKGAHSYGNRRTPRTEIQYGPGGYAYLYLIYGCHCCFNVVANREGLPQVVLVRALEPVEGLELMARRRGTDRREDLCSGPGKLCAALGITRAQYGEDLCGERLYVEDGARIPPEQILASPRINIDYAEECRDYLWRYYLRDNPFVSRVPRRYREAAVPLEAVRY